MTTSKIIAILIGLTLFAYLSSFTNPFIWDDEQFIQKNVYVQTFNIGKIFTTNTVAGAGISSNYYRPLTSLSFAIDTKVWGQNPFGFHLTNLLLHVGAGIVLFLLLLHLGFGKLISFAISGIFLIHPVQVEAVTYINSRGDSQYAFFFFLSLLLFVLGLQVKRPHLWYWVGSIVFFVVSILSKETAIAGFSLFLAVVFFQCMKTHKINNKALIASILITCCSFGYFLLRITLLNFQNTLNFYNTANIYATNVVVRLLTFGKVLWTYIAILLFPYQLHMERSVSLVTTIFSPYVFASMLVLIGLVMLSYWEIKQQKTYQIALGSLFFVSFLIPVSGIIPVNGVLYEHWLYIPLVGFFIVLFRTIQIYLLKLPKLFGNREKIIGIMLLCCIYSILTIQQNNIWSDPITFYTYTLSFAPGSARLHNNLAMSLENKNMPIEAVREYEKALQIDASYPQIYNNLGNIYISLKQYDKAEVNLRKALELAPSFEVAKENLIKLYLTQKRFDKALEIAKGNTVLINVINQAQKSK